MRTLKQVASQFRMSAFFNPVCKELKKYGVDVVFNSTRFVLHFVTIHQMNQKMKWKKTYIHSERCPDNPILLSEREIGKLAVWVGETP